METSTTNTAAWDKGPWHVGKDARDVFSADFTADVALRISGDFRDDEHKRQYTEWLVNALNAAALTQQQGGVDALVEAYRTWPDDIRRKLSVHDLRRMSGWAPHPNPADWGIDTSAGRPILVYQKCSVIEAEQARYVLGLVAADAAKTQTQQQGGEQEAGDVERQARELLASHSDARGLHSAADELREAIVTDEYTAAALDAIAAALRTKQPAASEAQ